MEYNSQRSVEKIKSIIGDDPQQVRELIEIFISVIPGQLEDFIRCINGDDLEHLNDRAHTLKPSFEVMGLVELKEKVLTVQELARNHYDKSEMMEVADTIKEKLDVVLHSLKQYLEEQNPKRSHT